MRVAWCGFAGNQPLAPQPLTCYTGERMTRIELDSRILSQLNIAAVREGVALVERARAFAIEAHGDQMYGDKPYSFHLEAVENVLIEFNHVPSILRAIAWLHDVVEDTPTTAAEIHYLFPGYVGIMVEALTSVPGKNRIVRNLLTYPNIVKYPEAILVKLADRIANTRNCLHTNNAGLMSMYKREYPGFREALKIETEYKLDPMWRVLDHLMDFREYFQEEI